MDNDIKQTLIKMLETKAHLNMAIGVKLVPLITTQVLLISILIKTIEFVYYCPDTKILLLSASNVDIFEGFLLLSLLIFLFLEGCFEGYFKKKLNFLIRQVFRVYSGLSFTSVAYFLPWTIFEPQRWTYGHLPENLYFLAKSLTFMMLIYTIVHGMIIVRVSKHGYIPDIPNLLFNIIDSTDANDVNEDENVIFLNADSSSDADESCSSEFVTVVPARGENGIRNPVISDLDFDHGVTFYSDLV